MANGYMKEVEFFQYCKTCIHKEVIQTEDPCNECLTCSAREESKRPINYKPDENELKKIKERS